MNNTFYTMALFEYKKMKDGRDEWKDRIRQQWRESIKMPRKKKKKIRKSLLLDWKIANYDPYSMF